MNDDYSKMLEMSYEEVIKKLLYKYGGAIDDYYSAESYNKFKQHLIKAPTKRKITRTSEGLYCHHIDEDKQIMISTPSMIHKYNIPFDFQKKD